MDDAKTIDVLSMHGRDTGKTFHVQEIDPVTFSGYVLRLVAALRVESYQGLIAEFQAYADGSEERTPIDAIMRVLQGADPVAVHALITELLTHVTIAPDPQHPGVSRPLDIGGDIRELKTLGEVLMASIRLNFGSGL